MECKGANIKIKQHSNKCRSIKKEELIYGSNSDLNFDGSDTESGANIDNISTDMLHQ
jgi:hypothetical protein